MKMIKFKSKETFFLLIILIYFAYWSWKLWGQKFVCRGLDEKFYNRFVSKHLKYEDRCRNFLESLFDVPFSKCRPDFLRNPLTHRKLELDGYSPSIPTELGMGLAFEFNGPQHYFFTPKYHKCIEDFEEQILRDKYKRQLCKENGILLLTIPYNVEIEDYILKKLYEKDLYYFFK